MKQEIAQTTLRQVMALIDRSRDEERDIVESLGETLEGLSKSFVHGISKLPVVPAFDISGSLR